MTIGWRRSNLLLRSWDCAIVTWCWCQHEAVTSHHVTWPQSQKEHLRISAKRLTFTCLLDNIIKRFWYDTIVRSARVTYDDVLTLLKNMRTQAIFYVHEWKWPNQSTPTKPLRNQQSVLTRTNRCVCRLWDIIFYGHRLIEPTTMSHDRGLARQAMIVDLRETPMII